MPTKLDPYLAYLEERWQAGSRNRLQLWREIREQGFDGTHQLLYGWTQKKGFKKKGSAKELIKDQSLNHKFSTPKARPWAASRASYLLFLGDKELTPGERSALHRMIVAEPAVETAITLAHEFRSMLINRQAELLPAWLCLAQGSGISTLNSFVNGLEKDLNAVNAAFSLSWSNGPTERSVNRLKLIKRQMYGRGNLDLLRRRVLGLPSDP